MPDLNELFAQAAQVGIDLNDDAQRESAFAALKKHWNGMYTALTNLGFGAAQSRFERELAAEKTARQEAEQTTATLKEKLAAKETPEIKQLNADWQTRLDTETRKLKDELDVEKSRTKTALLARDQVTLAQRLIDLGVPAAAAPILAKDPDLLPKRSEYDLTNGSLTIFQAGQKIPFSPGEGQTHLSLLADEMVQRPDIKQILIKDGDTGGGILGGANMTPATGDKAYFDSIRKQAEAERKSEQPRVSLRERVRSR